MKTMRFEYFNDTGKAVSIHPATFSYGCSSNEKPIMPLEERVFILPENTFPWIKMWDYEEKWLQILIVPKRIDK